MGRFSRFLAGSAVVLGAVGCALAQNAPVAKPEVNTNWKQTGWGGGGFYYAAAFHPTREGVIYLAGDVAGVYKSEDHGKNFRMINNGLVNYGVFSLAVDRSSPETVYAATSGGLCKSVDAGESWQPVGEGDLLRQLAGIKGRSIRSVAVDPTNSNVVYVGSPYGKVYKSEDGGKTWVAVYQKQADPDSADSLQVQFGKVNADYHGGFWLPLQSPAGVKPQDISGFAFSFKGGTAEPRDAFVTLKTASGASYRSKDLGSIFTEAKWQDIVLSGADFVLDPEFAKKNPEQAKTLPATPDWTTVNRMDFSTVGDLPGTASTARFGRIFLATNDAKPAVLRDFAKDKEVRTYGNIRVAAAGRQQPQGEPVYSVAVAAKDPSMVLAATADSGLLMSSDAGKTWKALSTPKKATNVAVFEGDPSIIYATFGPEGVWKSTDKGQNWTKISQGLAGNFEGVEVAISPKSAQDVYVIGRSGWGGMFYSSHDGGTTWTQSSNLKVDHSADPTLPLEGDVMGFSAPTNLAISPLNPSELYVSANWRSAWSGDAGKSWEERVRGADISCVYDIRFLDGKTYVSAMDEGTLVSEDNGADWRQLWPTKWNKEVSGHNWRVAISNVNGVHRVISTCSPWDSNSNRIIRSEDGGKTYSIVLEGLPDYYPKANTMWEKGYARALAVDPKNPDVVYLGIDGEPENGKMGGGIFKSVDGGKTWKQLPNQPPSRRMFFGLAVDPTDSNRLFWAACATNGGLYRSDDAGQSWKLVNKGDQWPFNVLVTADGTVYCPGKNLFRSTDHGETWKQLTKLDESRTIVGMEAHPTDPQTLWIATTTWDGSSNGAVYKTSDGGATWQEITGNLPYRKPLVLRFNPQTNDLWAGGVGLYRLPQ